jgi:hypothetical protein
MLRLPVDVFVTSLDVVLRGMREVQAVFNEAADALTADVPGDVSAALGAHRALPEPAAASAGPGDFSPLPVEKEKRAMPTIDLGGDDVKNVSYWITFVKTDFVATLQDIQSETIDWPTDAESFGGLKLGKFLKDLAEGRVAWPAKWDVTKPGRDYEKLPPDPDRVPGGKSRLKEIPERDQKYLRINLRINWRQPQPDAEREKDKVEVLREIRDELQSWK